MRHVASRPYPQQQGNAQKTDLPHRNRRLLTGSVIIVCWVLGVLTLAMAAQLTHTHPAPWPIELAFTRSVQHLSYQPWMVALLDFIGTFNNPTPAGIAFGFLVTGIALMGWYRQALFLALTVGIGNALDALIGDYVRRPRPSPGMVHVDVPLKYNSFPSGHTCHMMLFYGFLLYLTFSKPVRSWRYRWALLPVQVFAALNILLMGYARVYEGEHWLGDVLAGYLSGALWLALFLGLYHWATRMREHRQAKRAMNPPANNVV